MEPTQATDKVVQKVLVISSDKNFAETLVKKLSENGYDTRAEADGEAGLKSIYDFLPHLILLDIEIQGLSSYDILERKQAESLLVKIPVFLMSTQGVPINMTLVPQGSIKEFIVSLHSDVADVVTRINKHFGRNVIQPQEKAIGASKKILWVEDDKLIGSILSKKLITSGFNLTLAKNGEQAIDELNKMMPDAIVVDLLLPGMTGFDILQQIRANDKYKNVPVMVLSNLSKPSDVERAKVLGAQKFMVKATASLDQIVTEVNNLCK